MVKTCKKVKPQFSAGLWYWAYPIGTDAINRTAAHICEFRNLSQSGSCDPSARLFFVAARWKRETWWTMVKHGEMWLWNMKWYSHMFPSYLTSLFSTPRPGHICRTWNFWILMPNSRQYEVFKGVPLHDKWIQLTSVMIRCGNDPPSTGQQIWCWSWVLLLREITAMSVMGTISGHGTHTNTPCTCANLEYWFHLIPWCISHTLRGPSIQKMVVRLLSHQLPNETGTAIFI